MRSASRFSRNTANTVPFVQRLIDSLSPSSTSLPILLARINGSQVGFSALAVGEIARAVAIAPLPGSPDIIEGAINLHGRIVPVMDIRQRFGLPAVEVTPDQFLVVLEVADRLIAIRVDDVEDVIGIEQASLESPDALSPVLQRLEGVRHVDDVI